MLDTEQEQFFCGGTTVVELGGEIDIATAEDVFARLVAAVGHSCVILDLSAVEFIDASGINALVRAAREATRLQRHLVLSSPPRQLPRIIDVLDLHGVLPTHSDPAAARRAHENTGHSVPPQAAR